MRIALDATYSIDPHPSGIAVYSRELMAGLASRHPDNFFLHCFRPKQFRKASAPAARNIRNRLLLPPLPTFSADIYHALNQRVDRRPARRVVSTFHDLFVITGDYSSTEFRRRFTEQATLAADRSDLVIAVSEFTARQVKELLGFERSRIRVIPHGVRPLPHDRSASREPLILFVGALQKRKNISRLIEAFESLPGDWRLALAGSTTGFGAGEILQQIERSSRRSQIDVKGYVADDDLGDLYRRASIFAFPSLDEGFGLPILEAMARGLPVLTSNRSALEEVAGDAALLVNPEDTEAIRNGLSRLASDESLRSDLYARGLARASTFSWQKAVEETWAVYAELARRE